MKRVFKSKNKKHRWNQSKLKRLKWKSLQSLRLHNNSKGRSSKRQLKLLKCRSFPRTNLKS